MQKVIEIEGMSCPKCSKKIEESLNTINGVNAKVNLENKEATISMKFDVPDALLTQMVKEAGYNVNNIKAK